MADPALLLSPDESRRASGTVTPTVNGSVSVVEGTYGNAWLMEGGNISVAAANALDASTGTILIRLDTSTFGRNIITIGIYGTANGEWGGLFTLGSGIRWRWRHGADDQVQGQETGPLPPGLQTIFLRHSGTFMEIGIVGGARRAETRDAPFATFNTNGITIGSTNESFTFLGTMESLLFYNDRLTLAQIQNLAGKSEAWTWENTTIPDTPRIFPVLKPGPRPIAMLTPH